jgi:hypothetical protein
MQTYVAGLTHKVTPDQKMKNPTHEGCCRIRVVSTVPCFIKITKDGEEASEDDFPIVARVPEYLTVSHGGVKVAALFAPLWGELFVTEIS